MFVCSLVSFPAPGSYEFSEMPVFSMEDASDEETEKEVDPLDLPVDPEDYWMPVRNPSFFMLFLLCFHDDSFFVHVFPFLPFLN